MQALCDSLQLDDGSWTLQPMLSSDLKSSDLSTILQDALERVKPGRVAFLGMDAPRLPLTDLVQGLSSKSRGALLCPANDGGYGMLCVDRQEVIQSSIFANVEWSTSLTGLAQVKALTDQGIAVSIGSLMEDVDEPEDVANLANPQPAKTAIWSQHLGDGDLVTSSHSECSFTRKVLEKYGLWK